MVFLSLFLFGYQINNKLINSKTKELNNIIV